MRKMLFFIGAACIVIGLVGELVANHANVLNVSPTLPILVGVVGAVMIVLSRIWPRSAQRRG
jgi:Na+/citrate or Na+/malate symporter